MPLTTEQIQLLSRIIRDHHTGLVIDMFGTAAAGIPSEEIDRLVRLGIIDRDAAKALTVDLVGDTFRFAMMQIQLESLARRAERKPADTDSWSYDTVRDELARDPLPLSPRENDMIDIAQRKAGSYMTVLGDRVANDMVTAGISEEQELAMVRDEMFRNVERRESVRKLASRLGNRTGDWSRDWVRVARTEIQTTSNLARGEAIGTEFGGDALLARVPNPGACPICLRLFLDPETGKPKIWKLSTLLANGSNRGKKQADWLATLETVHPNCHCRVRYVGEGWEFNDKWELIPEPIPTE